jgi:hypothetical protein
MFCFLLKFAEKVNLLNQASVASAKLQLEVIRQIAIQKFNKM